MENKFVVEVAYAKPEKQVILSVIFDKGRAVSVKDAIMQSGILSIFPEIDLNTQKVGIFSKLCQLSDMVREGDRVEIYRPLLIDPKETRRRREKRE